MTSGHYDKKFYETNYPDSKTSAQIVLNHVLSLIPGVESVVDVGCGTGVWLSVLKEKGVKTIQGYDGNWVLGAEALAIPRECFSAVDLNKSFEVDRRFDLAMSMNRITEARLQAAAMCDPPRAIFVQGQIFSH